MAEKREGKGCLRLLKRTIIAAAALFLVFVAIAGALWYTGRPQQEALAFAGRKFLGADIRARGISVGRVITIERLTILDAPGTAPANAPLAVLGDIRIDYAVRPADGRYISGIRIASVDLTLDTTDPNDTNFDFLRELFAQETTTETNTDFIPKSVTVDRLTVEARTPNGIGRVQNLHVASIIQNVDALQCTVGPTSDALIGASWQSPSRGERHALDGGHGELVFARDGAELTADVSFGLHSDAEPNDRIAGMLRAELRDDAIPVRITCDTLRLTGETAVPILRDFLTIPIDFDVASIEDARIETAIVDGRPSFPDATFAAAIDNLRAGETDHLWYSGALSFRAETHAGDTNRGTFELALNEGQRLRAELSGNAEAGELSAAIEGWSPDETRSALPADFKSTLDAFDFESVGGYMTATWSPDGYEVKGDVQTHGAAGGAEPVRFTVAASGGAEDGPLIQGTLGARLGEGAVDAEVRAENEDTYQAEISFAGITPTRWAGFLANAAVPEELRGQLAGAIDVRAQEADDYATIRPRLTWNEFEAGGIRFESVAIDGELRGKKRFDAITGGTLNFAADDTQTLALSGIRLAFEPMTGRADLTANIDLYPLVTDTEYADFYGTIAAQGKLALREGRLTGPLSATTEFFGYGDYGVPYGSELAADAQLDYVIEDGAGALKKVTITIADRLTIESPTVALATSPFSASGDLTARMNFALLVDMTLLGRADGTLEGSASFTYDADNGPRATWNAAVNAAHLVLPNDAAYADEVYARLDGRYEDGVYGGGRVEVKRLSAAGAAAHNVSGEAVMSGEVLRLGGFTGTVFNGPVIADVAVGLFEEGLPIYVTGQFNRIDLAQLTAEVQPGEVRLTGIASGSGSVTYSAKGLQDLRLRGESTEDFSLDRATVEDLLFREQILERFSTRQLERILREFAGEAPQRPFDYADMHLRLEDGRIKGTANLVGEKTKDLRGLNLIVELAIDPEQLAETLVLLEQGDISGVDF